MPLVLYFLCCIMCETCLFYSIYVREESWLLSNIHACIVTTVCSRDFQNKPNGIFLLRLLRGEAEIIRPNE